MLVWHAHTSGPFGAVNMKVMVHAAPGHPDRVPQTVVLPNWELLMMTSTPGAPGGLEVEHVSLPVRSVAPRIFDVIVTPTLRP